MNTERSNLNFAIDLHRAGRLTEAEQLYRQVIQSQPENSQAIYRLGVLASQVARDNQAIDLLQRAVEIDPHLFQAYLHLGGLFLKHAQPDLAIDAFEKAARLQPNHAVIHHHRGLALHRLGRIEDAIAAYDRASQLRPNYAEAYYHQGLAFIDQQRPDKAIHAFQLSLQGHPTRFETHNNLGRIYEHLHDWEQAAAAYRRALELRPDFAQGHFNLGLVLTAQGRFENAVASFRQAIQLRPMFPEAYLNLGSTFQAMGDIASATSAYRQAIQLRPNDLEALYNLGCALEESGDLEAAVQVCRQVLPVRPAMVEGLLVHLLQQLCDWDGMIELSNRLIQRVKENEKLAPVYPIQPFTFVCLPIATTASQQLECARQWNAAKRMQLTTPITVDRFAIRARDKQRIRIGYLSADFYSHATAWLITEMLESHDRRNFEVFGYSFGMDDGSPTRNRILASFDHMRDVRSTSYSDTAKLIADDEIDILVDLKGYTQHARTQILAARPAPIQVNYLGYPATMGADFIDYILVDDFVVPAHQQPFFTERLVHLSGCYQVNSRASMSSFERPSRAECGLPESGFVFCCFNNNYKITPPIFDIWMRLLKSQSNSVLWLLETNRFVAANLRREAIKRGIEAERLVFAPKLPISEHLARHVCADLFLDTFPVNAHTTASDAIRMHLPILTLAGQTFVSRVAGSVLRTVGLPELIADSYEAYEAIASRLSHDRWELGSIRQKLAENLPKSSLFDGQAFAQKIEAAYVMMWANYREGKR